MIRPLFKLYVDLLIDFFNFVNLSLKGNSIFIEDIISRSSLFALVKSKGSLKFIDKIVLFCHLFCQHLKTFLFLFTLDFLPPVIFLNLIRKMFFCPFEGLVLASEGKDLPGQGVDFVVVLGGWSGNKTRFISRVAGKIEKHWTNALLGLHCTSYRWGLCFVFGQPKETSTILHFSVDAFLQSLR